MLIKNESPPKKLFPSPSLSLPSSLLSPSSSSVPSVFPANGNGNGAEGAPVTPVTFLELQKSEEKETTMVGNLFYQ
ncbi:MAG: hypothetical protein ACR2IS_00215 [Nitrososphaeraceae archaeon]